jgi:hypothetical protein
MLGGVCRIKLYSVSGAAAAAIAPGVLWSATAEVSYFQAPLTYNNAALLNVRTQVEGLKKEKGAAARIA